MYQLVAIIFIISLQEGNMSGAYLGEDGYVHIPGKRTTLYSPVSPPQPSKPADPGVD